MPAATSVVRLIRTEIVVLTTLFVDKMRKRAVPVDAASAIGTVVIALVAELLTIVVIAPVQAPVASVQVPEQRCMVNVLGAIDVKICWIPKEVSGVLSILLTLK